MKSSQKLSEPEPEARASGIETHPRWPEVLGFLNVEPGDNGSMTKALRDLRRVEQEQREAGSGPDLQGEIRRLEQRVRELAAATEPCRACRRPVGPELVRQRDEAEDALSAKLQELQSRDARSAAIRKRQKEAHAGAVAALHGAIRSGMGKLAHEATLIVKSAPAAALLHPARLPDSLLEVERQVALGHGLGLAFSSVTPGETASGADFWAALPEDVGALLQAKIRGGRSAAVAAA